MYKRQVDVQLVVDVHEVGLDRGLADEQAAGDLLVGQALGEQAQDLDLARRQGGPAGPYAAEQAGGDGRGQDGFAAGGGVDGGGDVLRRGVLEQIAGGPGLDGREDVGVRAVGGEDEHRRGLGESGDAAGGLDAVHAVAHLEVHEHDVGPGLPALPRVGEMSQRGRAVRRFADGLDAGQFVDHGAEPAPYDGVVVHQEYADHAAARLRAGERGGGVFSGAVSARGPGWAAAAEPSHARAASVPTSVRAV